VVACTTGKVFVRGSEEEGVPQAENQAGREGGLPVVILPVRTKSENHHIDGESWPTR
jgi:hypothetical protein